MKKLILVAAIALLPTIAFAQGTGSNSGGGTASGSAGGAPAGGITGKLTPRFKTYVEAHEVPSYSYQQPLRVGTVLPETGVTYGEVPTEYGVKGYRYTVVNDQAVIVEPRTRKVIQIIE